MQLFRVLFFLSVFLGAVTSHAAGSGKQASEKILLKDVVLLTGSKVILGDICTLVNRQQADKKLISDESLKSIEIGKLKPMEVAVISRMNIARKLKRFGVLIPIVGADKIRVTRRGRIWGTGDLKKNIMDWVLNTLKTSKKTVHVQFVSKLRQLVLPVDVEIRKELPAKIKPFGLQSIRLTFFDNGVKLLSQSVSLRIDARVDAFVLKRDMVKGDVLSMDSFQKTKVFASKISRTEIIDPLPYLGWKLKNFLKKGEFIKPSYLKKNYMIKRGALVNIVAEKYGFLVSARGYAKKNGVKNDLIPIKNMASGKIVLGKVVDINLVKVEF